MLCFLVLKTCITKSCFLFTAARTPFSIRFISDHYDYTGERATTDLPNGFCLIYQQYSCN